MAAGPTRAARTAKVAEVTGPVTGAANVAGSTGPAKVAGPAGPATATRTSEPRRPWRALTPAGSLHTSNDISQMRSRWRAIAESGRQLVSDAGRLSARTGNAGPQAAAACRAEVRDANTTVELR